MTSAVTLVQTKQLVRGALKLVYEHYEYYSMRYFYCLIFPADLTVNCLPASATPSLQHYYPIPFLLLPCLQRRTAVVTSCGCGPFRQSRGTWGMCFWDAAACSHKTLQRRASCSRSLAILTSCGTIYKEHRQKKSPEWADTFCTMSTALFELYK